MDRGTEWTRRGTLRRCGEALATGGLAAVAGCTGAFDAGGDGTAANGESGRGWTGPAYGRWLPAPGTVLPVPQYRFGMTDLAEYAEHVGGLPGGVRGVVESWGPVGIDWRTVPRALTLHGNNVIEADHDRDAVADGVAAADGWGEAGDHEGYALFRNGEGRAIAVGDGAVVVTHGYGESKGATEVARGLIDTARGEVTTYPGGDAAVDAVMDEFEDGGFTNMWVPVELFDETPGAEPEFDGQVGIGRWGRFGDGATEVKLIVAFESAAAADPDRVRSYVEQHGDDGEQFAPWEDVAVGGDGRVVTVEGTVRRDR